MTRRPPSGTVFEADDRPTIVTRDSDLDGQPSARSLRGLDWLNFLLADVQSGVKPFLAIYLAGYGWNEQRVGLALTIGAVAGIASQTPAGALVDWLKSKRALSAAGVVALAIGALFIAFFPSFWPVVTAQMFIGAMSSFFMPAIAAVSLGIVGHRLFNLRQGRNQAFNSAGNVVAAVMMGLIGYFISNRGVFFFVAVLAVPTIAGSIVHHFSDRTGFLFLASVAAAAFAILWLFMPETLDWKGGANRLTSMAKR